MMRRAINSSSSRKDPSVQVLRLRLQEPGHSTLSSRPYQPFHFEKSPLSAAEKVVASRKDRRKRDTMVILDEATKVPCNLECANGGYCTFVADDDAVTLQREVQSGQLVQRCVCRPGFSGLGCEIEIPQCSFPERKCHNGAPCVESANGDWRCDCSLADRTSAFAGQ